MDAMENLENLIFHWMLTLPEEEQDKLWNGYNVIDSMPADAQEELKNEIFRQMIDEVNYVRLIKRLRDHLRERIIETQSVEESDDANDQDSTG
jgi:hypothetical protein